MFTPPEPRSCVKCGTWGTFDLVCSTCGSEIRKRLAREYANAIYDCADVYLRHPYGDADIVVILNTRKTRVVKIRDHADAYMRPSVFHSDITEQIQLYQKEEGRYRDAVRQAIFDRAKEDLRKKGTFPLLSGKVHLYLPGDPIAFISAPGEHGKLPIQVQGVNDEKKTGWDKDPSWKKKKVLDTTTWGIHIRGSALWSKNPRDIDVVVTIPAKHKDPHDEVLFRVSALHDSIVERIVRTWECQQPWFQEEFRPLDIRYFTPGQRIVAISPPGTDPLLTIAGEKPDPEKNPVKSSWFGDENDVCAWLRRLVWTPQEDNFTVLPKERWDDIYRKAYEGSLTMAQKNGPHYDELPETMRLLLEAGLEGAAKWTKYREGKKHA